MIDYGAGNLRSVVRALAKVGANFQVTSDPDVVDTAATAATSGTDCLDFNASASCTVSVDAARPAAERAVLAHFGTHFGTPRGKPPGDGAMGTGTDTADVGDAELHQRLELVV